ncbi:hypothetical protein FQA39_LY10649 [Lamprigera yunnana]|nr:hypothetical protein FQA39_LY10649 [Lamprigera yunnana]
MAYAGMLQNVAWATSGIICSIALAAKTDKDLLGVECSCIHSPSNQVGLTEEGLQDFSNEETKKLQEEIKCLRKEQREFKDEIKEIKKSNGIAKKEIEDLKNKVDRANERIEKMKGEKRIKNIVAQGLRGSSTNPKILKELMEGFM